MAKAAEYYPPPVEATAQGIPASSVGNQNYPPPAAAVPPFQVHHRPTGQWTTGLCDCCDDCSNCCITCWCPCITFGQIADILDRGSTSCGASGALYGLICAVSGCQCIYSCFYRTKLRSQYGLTESPCADCLVHCFCEQCALCQEYRQLKSQGFDMNIGWQANVERMGGGANVPPVMQGGMTR